VTAATRAGALIGRGSELAHLAGLIRDAAAGQGSAVLIEGEPGIGKSSLVRAALAEAEVRCPVFCGAVALGHPLGASGARIATTLLYRMRDTGARYGIATLCVGQGQGVATIFENCT
jgi:acetyl-CoA acetyltransferase